MFGEGARGILLAIPTNVTSGGKDKTWQSRTGWQTITPPVQTQAWPGTPPLHYIAGDSTVPAASGAAVLRSTADSSPHLLAMPAAGSRLSQCTPVAYLPTAITLKCGVWVEMCVRLGYWL